MWNALISTLNWTRRLAPALVMLSLFFALDGNLRWLGVMGLPLLYLAFRRDLPSCACMSDDAPRVSTFPGP